MIDPLTAEAQRSAVEALPAFLERLEAVAALEGGARQTAHESLGTAAMARSREGLARRVAGVAQARNAPPEAPISVSVTGYTSLVQRGGTTPVERAIRQRFVAMARSEETVAAEYALLRSRLPGGASEAAATVLTVAVALRPYAQDRGWLPGTGANGSRAGRPIRRQGRFSTATYPRTGADICSGDWRRRSKISMRVSGIRHARSQSAVRRQSAAREGVGTARSRLANHLLPGGE